MLRKSLILIVMLIAVGMFSLLGLCADCAVGGSVDTACKDEADENFSQCCGVFNCNNDQQGNYCYWRAEDARKACAILHGCPNLAN